jgi:competence protein ComFC
MISGAFRKSSGFLSSLYEDFREFLSPSFCPGCGGDDLDRSAFPLCSRCHQLLVASNAGGGPVCPFCGRPEGIGTRCEFCVRDDRIRLFFWGSYDDLLKDCIAAFKFDGFPELGPPLMEMALKNVSERLGEYDFAIPVPLHRQRREERGYNQSEILARCVSETMKVELAPGVLERTKPTRQQAKLAVEERRINVRDAFAVDADRGHNLSGRKVLLVDDIVTTGATIFEAARPLRSCGASRIDVLALAYAQ